MRKFLLLIVLIIPLTSWGQEPELERDVEQERSLVDANNSFTRIVWGTHLGEGEGDSLKTIWPSTSISASGVQVIRPAKFYSLLISYGFQYDKFRLKQDSMNLLALNVNHKKQHLHLYTGKIGIGNRFHIGKHGVKEGVYIEVGGAASIKLTSRMRIQNEIDPKLTGNNGAEEEDLYFKKLKFTELIGYYATAAIGRNGLSLYGQYRLSDMFKKYEGINNNRKLPELTPLNIGIRLEF